jgi:branched-subunit amino acid aminotransferase/4-amino-4-deoxychorismate lyase
MRAYLISALPEYGYYTAEQSINPDSLAGADAVFLCNAVRGLRWVFSIGGTCFSPEPVREIHDKIRHTLAAGSL